MIAYAPSGAGLSPRMARMLSPSGVICRPWLAQAARTCFVQSAGPGSVLGAGMYIPRKHSDHMRGAKRRSNQGAAHAAPGLLRLRLAMMSRAATYHNLGSGVVICIVIT